MSTSGRPSHVERLEPRRLFAADPTLVDVAVVYTPAAKAAVGGADAVLQRARRAVAETNLVLANSRIDAALRLVSVNEVAYAESGVLATDLGRLQNGADGFLDAAQGYRNAAGADLVHLLVSQGDDAGLGYQLDNPSYAWPDYGYAVSQVRYTADAYLFAHETLHNLGAGHDDADLAAPRTIPSAYEMTFATGAQLVGGVMSGYGARIPYTSNPDVAWRGQPLGAAEGSAAAAAFGHAADNARVVRQFLPIVAANRQPTVADTEGPRAALHQAWVDPAGATLYAEVRLADDLAVDVDTLDGGDVRVTGPGGFDGLARFVSVDRATNGPQRLARYAVDLAGAPADPTAYTFTLNANAVTDTGGRPAAGGVLGVTGTPGRFADRAGPRLVTALELGDVTGTRRAIADAVLGGGIDPSNFYRFTLTEAADVAATITGLSANANLFLLEDVNRDGLPNAAEYLRLSTQAGTAADAVSATLPAGDYFVWVAPVGPVTTSYTLSLQAGGGPVVPPPPPPPPPPPSPPSPPPPPPTTTGGTIAGSVWRDDNGNGVRDAGEAGLAGWTVYADVNNNGARDGPDVAATTDAAGGYALRDLPARGYVVRSSLAAGYRRTNTGSYSLTLSAGQTITGRSFGATTRALASGAVFLDANRNRARDAGESALGGWQVYLDRNNNARLDAGERTATTDLNGFWAVRDVLPGSYVARVVVKAGYAVTTPAAGHPVALGSGQAATSRNFGLRRV